MDNAFEVDSGAELNTTTLSTKTTISIFFSISLRIPLVAIPRTLECLIATAGLHNLGIFGIRNASVLLEELGGQVAPLLLPNLPRARHRQKLPSG